MASDYPLIDGHKHDHSSIEIQVSASDGSPRIFNAVSEISYGQSLSPGVVRGTLSQPLAFTQGKLDPGEGSISMPKEDAQDLRDTLGDGYMAIPVTITVSYSSYGSPTITDTLVGVRIVKDDTTSSADNEDPVMDTFELKYLRGTRGGKNPVPNMLV